MSPNHELLVQLFLLLQLVTVVLAQLASYLDTTLADNSKFVWTLNARFEEGIQLGPAKRLLCLLIRHLAKCNLVLRTPRKIFRT